MIKDYTPALIALLKGIVYPTNTEVWEKLLKYEADVKDYFSEINLQVYIDATEGYAYLRQKTTDEEENDLPKLIEKRPLNFHVSLLCLLLRKHLIENDNQGESSRAILSEEAIINLMRPFLKDTSDEVKQTHQVLTAVKKVIDEGFLRKINPEEKLYEINRIIKAFVNADTVQNSLEKLRNYKKDV